MKWKPLVADAEVLQKYAETLGVERVTFHDVYGLEEDACFWPIEQTIGFLFVYKLHDRPISTCAKSHPAEKAWFIKQKISNACGTIALLHLLMNTPKQIIRQGSVLSKLQTEMATMTPDERGDALKSFNEIANMHHEAERFANVSAEDDDVDDHFIAFVYSPDKTILECNGRQNALIEYDETVDAHCFAAKTFNIIKDKFIASSPSGHFALIALSMSS